MRENETVGKTESERKKNSTERHSKKTTKEIGKKDYQNR